MRQATKALFDKLTELRGMHPDTFDRIKESVDGDQDIATGTWTTTNNVGETCGCLLFDGYGKVHNLEGDNVQYAIEEESETEVFEILGEFYGVDGTTLMALHLVSAYDQWAGYRTNDQRERSESCLLTEAGRAELRELFAEVAAQ